MTIWIAPVILQPEFKTEWRVGFNQLDVLNVFPVANAACSVNFGAIRSPYPTSRLQPTNRQMHRRTLRVNPRIVLRMGFFVSGGTETPRSMVILAMLLKTRALFRSLPYWQYRFCRQLAPQFVHIGLSGPQCPYRNIP